VEPTEKKWAFFSSGRLRAPFFSISYYHFLLKAGFVFPFLVKHATGQDN